MFEFSPNWRLRRSPLAPSVPLEGSETVQGLRTLERLLTANLLNGTVDGDGRGGARNGSASSGHELFSRRRRYQRYKGPYLEQLTVDDLKKDPKPWKQFAPVEGWRWNTLEYSIPATLELMCERIEENLVHYAANYVWMLFAILLLTMYIRPRAILGAAALVFSIIHHMRRFNRMQRVASNARGREEELAVNNGGISVTHNSPLINPILTLVVWVIVVYTKCAPIIFLGSTLALITILLHAAVRQSPTEARYRARGRTVLSYSFAQFFRHQHVPDGIDTWLVFKQLWHVWVSYITALILSGRRWAMYHFLAAWDAMRKPFVPTLRLDSQSGWS